MLFEGTPCLAWIRGIYCVRLFPPYSRLVSWICFGPYCCLYPTTILMNVALNRIQWRVFYLARGTIERLKIRGVLPELYPKLQVKRLCVPVFSQRLVSKMFWHVFCVAVAICKSHETFVVYFASTSRLHLAQHIMPPLLSYILLVFLKLIKSNS